jgi:anthranilate phosphoribosyltransferase
VFLLLLQVAPVRRAVGVRTVFNILGPLLNPANAKRLMLGVYSPDLLELYGQTVHALGCEHALIVHCCGLDELAPLGTAEAVEVTPEKGVVRLTIDCTTAMGMQKCTIPDLAGGDCR